MSVFLVTNDTSYIDKAASLWEEFYGESDILDLSNGYQIVINRGYRSSRGWYAYKFPQGRVFGFGTYFDQNGFGDDIDAKGLDLINFNQQTTTKIYGHYTFVICQNNSIRILVAPDATNNIYCAGKSNSPVVSNDMMMAAFLEGSGEISKEGALQFIFDRFSHGSTTIFSNIRRNRPGHQFICDEHEIREESFYDYSPPELSIDEYIIRVESYFQKISKYKGRIGVDISAGYDSRLIAACAKSHLNNIVTFTNNNRRDGGVDLKIGKYVSKKLGLKNELIPEMGGKFSMHKSELLHSFTPTRSTVFSNINYYRSKKKYQLADLNILGQGVEPIHGKYPQANNMNKLVFNYFSGKDFEKYGHTKITKSITSVLENEYIEGWISSQDELNRWIYKMNFDRIICSSVMHGKMLMGDVLSPFLDWHLFSPMFRWDEEELRSKKVYSDLLRHFAPEVLNIPFNPPYKEMKYNHALYTALIKAVYKFKKLTPNKKNRKEDKLKEIYSGFPRERFDPFLLEKLCIDLGKMEDNSNAFRLNRIARVATIQLASERVQEMFNFS